MPPPVASVPQNPAAVVPAAPTIDELLAVDLAVSDSDEEPACSNPLAETKDVPAQSEDPVVVYGHVETDLPASSQVLAISTPEALYPCTFCGIWLPRLSKVIHEVQEHVPELHIMCSVCGIILPSHADRVDHDNLYHVNQ